MTFAMTWPWPEDIIWINQFKGGLRHVESSQNLPSSDNRHFRHKIMDINWFLDYMAWKPCKYVVPCYFEGCKPMMYEYCHHQQRPGSGRVWTDKFSRLTSAYGLPIADPELSGYGDRSLTIGIVWWWSSTAFRIFLASTQSAVEIHVWLLNKNWLLFLEVLQFMLLILMNVRRILSQNCIICL